MSVRAQEILDTLRTKGASFLKRDEAVDELIDSGLITSDGFLGRRGRCYLVVHKNLGSDSLARWLEERGHATRRLASKKGYRILEVSPRATSVVDNHP